MMAATAGHRLTLNPMGTCSNMNIMRYGVNINETTTPKSSIVHLVIKRTNWFYVKTMLFGFNCPSGFSKEVF
jgi:hypothetical protein